MKMLKLNKWHFALILFMGLILTSFGQQRKLVILSDSNSQDLQSVSTMLQQLGAPFDTAYTIIEAVEYPVIIKAEPISEGDIDASDINILNEYLTNGGAFIASSVSDSAVLRLGGLEPNPKYKNREHMKWNETSSDLFPFWSLDRPMVTYLTELIPHQSLNTLVYQSDHASVLATYDKEEVAVSKNTVGAGTMYLFGPLWQAVISPDLHQLYTEGSSTWTYVHLFRKLVASHVPSAVFKHLFPGRSIYEANFLDKAFWDQRTQFEFESQLSNGILSIRFQNIPNGFLPSIIVSNADARMVVFYNDKYQPIPYHWRTIGEENRLFYDASYGFDIATSIDGNFDQSNEVKVYPNPARSNSSIHIEVLEDAISSISLKDIHGAVVMQQQLPLAKDSVNLPSLAPGVYILKVEQNGSSIEKRLVICH